MRTAKDVVFEFWNPEWKLMIRFDNMQLEWIPYIKNFASKLIVRQWTGLLDKNGVKIFEGDVVKWVAYGYPSDEYPELQKDKILTKEKR